MPTLTEPETGTQAAQTGNRSKQKVVLITGASTGIGRVCGEHLANLGMTVYGASRSQPSGVRFHTLRMDVIDHESVNAGIGKR